jgi:hypothetical protein
MFNSTRRLPYIYGYEGAKKWFDQIKPLRSGARMGRRPLGGRKDTHMFIRENDEGSMECVCYDTAVVTFKQDGGVVVMPGKWPSSFTCAFIEGILHGTSANRTKGMVVLRLNSGTNFIKHPLKQNTSIELVRIPVEPGQVGRWEIRNAEGVHVWSPNRAASNNVRAKYKEMIGYHKGMVSLLTQEREKSNEDDPFEAAKILTLPKDMLADSLGTFTRMEHQYSYGQRTEVAHKYVNVDLFNKAVNHKPTREWYTHYEVGSPEHTEATKQARKRREDWLAVRDEVLGLMRSDQPEETKHANFLKATLGLMCAVSGVRALSVYGQIQMTHGYGLKGGAHIELSYSKASTAVTQFLTLAFAEEIMELKQMPVGRVPTTNYAEMLFDDFKNQGEMK